MGRDYTGRTVKVKKENPNGIPASVGQFLFINRQHGSGSSTRYDVIDEESGEWGLSEQTRKSHCILMGANSRQIPFDKDGRIKKDEAKRLKVGDQVMRVQEFSATLESNEGYENGRKVVGVLTEDDKMDVPYRVRWTYNDKPNEVGWHREGDIELFEKEFVWEIVGRRDFVESNSDGIPTRTWSDKFPESIAKFTKGQRVMTRNENAVKVAKVERFREKQGRAPEYGVMWDTYGTLTWYPFSKIQAYEYWFSKGDRGVMADDAPYNTTTRGFEVEIIEIEPNFDGKILVRAWGDVDSRMYHVRQKYINKYEPPKEEKMEGLSGFRIGDSVFLKNPEAGHPCINGEMGKRGEIIMDDGSCYSNLKVKWSFRESDYTWESSKDLVSWNDKFVSNPFEKNPRQLAIDEAKVRFSPGDTVCNNNLDCGSTFVVATNFDPQPYLNHQVIVKGASGGTFTVWKDGVWADIMGAACGKVEATNVKYFKGDKVRKQDRSKGHTVFGMADSGQRFMQGTIDIVDPESKTDRYFIKWKDVDGSERDEESWQSEDDIILWDSPNLKFKLGDIVEASKVESESAYGYRNGSKLKGRIDKVDPGDSLPYSVQWFDFDGSRLNESWVRENDIQSHRERVPPPGFYDEAGTMSSHIELFHPSRMRVGINLDRILMYGTGGEVEKAPTAEIRDGMEFQAPVTIKRKKKGKRKLVTTTAHYKN